MNQEKTPLVCIPGWGADHRVWESLHTELSNYFDFNYIELMSPEAFSSTELDALISDIAEQIEKPSVILAWSLGGMLALHLARRYPNKVRQLILIATNLSFVQVPEWPHAMPVDVFEGFLESFSDAPEKTQKRFISLQAQGDKNRKNVAQFLKENHAFSESNQQHALDLLQLLGSLDCRDVFEQLNIPTLMLFGEHDALVPAAACDAVAVMHEKAPMSEGSIHAHVIRHAGHAPQLSQVDQCLTHIFKFLGIRGSSYALEKRRVADAFSKASHTYDACAQLQKNVADKLVNLGEVFSGTVADLGCGTGYCIDAMLQKSDSINTIFAIDIAENMLQCFREKIEDGDVKIGNASVSFCHADIETLPLHEKSLDWIVCSLAVQWCENLDAVFAELCRTLSDDGSILLSNLGPSTLWELNEAWNHADPVHIHVNHFYSALDIANAAENAGLELQYVEEEQRVLAYQHVTDLMRDLKGIGAHNVNTGGNKGLTGKSTLQKVRAYYEQLRDENGMLPATYDLQFWRFSKRRVFK